MRLIPNCFPTNHTAEAGNFTPPLSISYSTIHTHTLLHYTTLHKHVYIHWWCLLLLCCLHITTLLTFTSLMSFSSESHWPSRFCLHNAPSLLLFFSIYIQCLIHNATLFLQSFLITLQFPSIFKGGVSRFWSCYKVLNNLFFFFCRFYLFSCFDPFLCQKK